VFAVRPQVWTHHRGAWKRAVRALFAVQDHKGPLLLTSVEDQLLLRGDRPDRPWAGVLHATPDRPAGEWSLGWFLAHPKWAEHKDRCVGLYVLAENSARFLRPRVHVPVGVFRLPMPQTLARFRWDHYRGSPDRRLVLVGRALRDYSALGALPPVPLRKCYLDGSAAFGVGGPPASADVTVIGRLEDDEYDELLSESVVFLPLKDAAACNAVVDCMALNTPVLTNRLPATEEYLGKDYPLFYDDLAEAARLVSDDGRVRAAHEYLRGMDKRHVTVAGMLFQLQESECWRRVGEKAEGGVTSWLTAKR
jgi:hypothetical protein